MASLSAVNFGVGEEKTYPCIEEFSKHVTRTVLVLEAKNTQQILNLHKYLQEIGMLSEYYIDEGVNEVDVYSVTALAVGPIWASDEEKREVLRSFPLYPAKKEKKRWWKNETR
jgi:peptidyl-tRNA hydrolase